MKKIMKEFVPPFIWGMLSSLYRRNEKNDDYLFDGKATQFKEILIRTRKYGEYGVGKSTKWVFNNTKAEIVAVDTSKVWADNISKSIGDQKERVKIRHIDLGAIGDWGRPLTFLRREAFLEYVMSIWTDDETPDTVLIDGRFRISCFFASMACAKPGTKIIFDDYIMRDHYKIVEEYFTCTNFCGRQAIFTVIDMSNEVKEQTLNLAKEFILVID
jgi:hypothetical protein